MLTERFPKAPDVVTLQLERLDRKARGTGEDQAGFDLSQVPCPWLPSDCGNELLVELLVWCDAVAAWINRECVWRPQQMIPACWPQHPHLVRELALLAILRYQAEQAKDVIKVYLWHHDVLTGFLNRVNDRLGTSTCQNTGTHQEWPGAPRYSAFTSEHAVAERSKLFRQETAHQPWEVTEGAVN